MMGRPGMRGDVWGRDWANTAAEYARRRARRRLFWDAVGAGAMVAVLGSSISWGPALVRWLL